MKTPTKRLLIFWFLCILLACGQFMRVAGWLPNSNAFAKDTSRFDIRTYGAKVDGQALGDGYGAWSRVQSDCSMTSGSAILSCASNHFASPDVGKVIAVYGAGPTNNGFVQPLSTRIASYSAGNRITLAAAALNSVRGSERVVWGHDDTSYIQAAINAACAAGKGTVYVPVGRSLTTGVTVGCSNVGVKGMGRSLSALENWNINPMNGNVPIVYFSVSGAADQSVVGVSLKDLEIRQVKYPTTVQQAFGLYQTFKALAEDLRVIGYSYECGVDGGGAHNYGDELRNSEFGPCGNGGPAYALTTAGINYNGAHVFVHDNEVSMAGQGVEYGGRGGMFRGNKIDGTMPNGGTNNFCFNIGSTGAGVWDVWVLGNTCKNTGGMGSQNTIGTLDRVHFESNKMIGGGGINIAGGLDSNSVVCYPVTTWCENDTVIHGTSSIKNNTFTGGAGAGAGRILAPPSGNLENVDIEGNLYEPGSGPTNLLRIANFLATWAPSTTYTAGTNNYIFPTVLNGVVYKSTGSCTSGTAEPTWPTTLTNRVTDGTCTWTAAWPQPAYTVKNEHFVYPSNASNCLPSAAGSCTVILQHVSREMVSMTNVSSNKPWSIYMLTSNGRHNVEAGPNETIPGGVPYDDMNRYWNPLPNTWIGPVWAVPPATYFRLGVRIWNPTSTSSAGQVVTTAGWNAPTWGKSVSFLANTYIQAPADNRHFYRNLAACKSGTSAPTFPTIRGAMVTESTGTPACTWIESGPDAQFAPLLGNKPPR